MAIRTDFTFKSFMFGYRKVYSFVKSHLFLECHPLEMVRLQTRSEMGINSYIFRNVGDGCEAVSFHLTWQRARSNTATLAYIVTRV